jgi:hypothetical protein
MSLKNSSVMLSKYRHVYNLLCRIYEPKLAIFVLAMAKQKQPRALSIIRNARHGTQRRRDDSIDQSSQRPR